MKHGHDANNGASRVKHDRTPRDATMRRYSGFEHERVSAEIDETLDLVDPGDACADDDYLVFVYATHCADSAGAPEWAPTIRGSG